MLKYYKELNGVRGLAALMIMYFHFFQTIKPYQNSVFNFFYKFSHFGQTGVTLFFVLSGFLISRILLSSKNTDNYFSSFYIRRSLRIFPLFYLFLVLTYYIVPWLAHQPIVPFSKQWSYWFYLQNFAITFNWDQIGLRHLWSLAVEEHFYLFWPFLIYFLNPRQLKISVYIIFAVALIVRLVLLNQHYNPFYFTFTNIDALSLGSLIALHELSGESKFNYGRLFIIVFIPTVLLWVFFGGSGNIFIQVIKLPLIAIAYYALIGFLISPSAGRAVKKVLDSGFFDYSGRISYGLYIYHPVIFHLYLDSSLNKGFFSSLIICFGLAYIIASISFYFFEAQFLKLKKYFEYGKSNKKITPVSN